MMCVRLYLTASREWENGYFSPQPLHHTQLDQRQHLKIELRKSPLTRLAMQQFPRITTI